MSPFRVVLFSAALAAVAQPTFAQPPSASSGAKVSSFGWTLLSVADLEASKVFYIDVLGMKLAHARIHDSPLGIGLNVSGGQTPGEPTLLIQQVAPGAVEGPITRASRDQPPIGLWVTGMDQILERAAKAKVEIVRPALPPGAPVRTVVLKDPDGVVVELLEANLPRAAQ
jgi:catechol 2,3-dioxygenase-like lactoylglutathione lyase family enzyme